MITIANLVSFDVPFWTAIELLEIYFANATVTTEAGFSVLHLGQRLPPDALAHAAAKGCDLRRRPAFAVATLGWSFATRFDDQIARSAHRNALLSLIAAHPNNVVHQLPEARFDPVLERQSYADGDRLWEHNVATFPDNGLVAKHAISYRRMARTDRKGEDTEGAP